MIALALKLSAGGVGDYWDDADRWLRNHFAEIQLTRTQAEHLCRISQSMEQTPLPYNATSDKVTERNIGAFAGWPTPNEWARHIGIQHCCTGNAARTIYYAWENILHYQDRKLQVHLLLNRASPWADVHSYLPYEGQVDLKIKEQCNSVLIRVPEWIKSNSDKVECTVNGKPRQLIWTGRYVDVGQSRRGDTVTMTFPIGERTVKERIGGADYTLIIKGNTVICIEPPGKNCPLYQREHYRTNQVHWRKMKRFVSNECIYW